MKKYSAAKQSARCGRAGFSHDGQIPLEKKKRNAHTPKKKKQPRTLIFYSKLKYASHRGEVGEHSDRKVQQADILNNSTEKKRGGREQLSAATNQSWQRVDRLYLHTLSSTDQKQLTLTK